MEYFDFFVTCQIPRSFVPVLEYARKDPLTTGLEHDKAAGVGAGLISRD